MAMDKVNDLKTTGQGISDAPEPVGTGSGRAGSPRPSASDCTDPAVEAQAADQGKATGTPIRGIGVKPKAVGLLRQPIIRSNSVSTSEEERKRKRGSITPHKEEIYKKKEDPVAFVILESLTMIKKYAEDLHKRIEQNPNTKREIKDISGSLKRQMEVFTRGTTKEWFEKHRWEVYDTPKYEVDVQVEPCTSTIGVQTEDMHASDKMKQLEMEVAQLKQEKKQLEGKIKEIMQTKEDNQPNEKVTEEYVRSRIVSITSKQDLMDVLKLNWPEEAYKSTKVFEGNPLLEAESDSGILVPKEDKEMGRNLPKLYREKYPELTAVEDESGVSYLVIQTKIFQNKEMKTKEKYIYKITIDDEGDKETELLKKIRQLKQTLEESGRKKILLPVIEKASWKAFRKIVEIVFNNSGIEVMVYVPKGTLQDQNRPDRKTEAIIIKQQNKSYAELLKEVKEITTQAGGNNTYIKGVRKTRDGSLLLEFEKGEQNMAVIGNKIKEKMQNANVRMGQETRYRTVHIYNLDAIINEGEIVEELRKVTQSTEAINVISLKANARDGQSAILRTTEKMAANLIQIKKMRIGFNICSIRENVRLIKCYRCWEPGHVAENCQGPNREELCRRCGEKGHKRDECHNAMKCVLCNGAHFTGSLICGKYKEALKTKLGHTGSSNPR